MAELTRRYVVMAMASEAPFDPSDPDGVFVLKPWKDPAALRALRAYRDNCYPELSQDLESWIVAIESGPVIRGDVGRRNEPHVRPDGPRASSAARGASRSASAARKRPAAGGGRRRRRQRSGGSGKRRR